MTTDQERVVKLRVHLTLLRDRVYENALYCKDLLDRYEAGDIILTRREIKHNVVGEAHGYEIVLGWIDDSMRELGIDHGG